MIVLVLAVVFGAEPRVLVWGAEYCSPCGPMQAVVEQLAAEGWPIGHHDVDQEHQASAAWKIRQTPTTSVVADGRELERIVGRIDRAALVSLMKRNGINPPERRKIAWDTGKYL